MTHIRTVAAIGLFLGLSASLQAQTPAPKPRLDPQADELLKKMCALLAASKTFTVEAHTITEQLLPSGQKIQLARNQKIALRRPDGLAADALGDNDESRFVYDGKTVTLLNLGAKTYAQAAAPASVDAALDMLATKYGVVLPLADLVFADPYKALGANLRSGQYLGTGYVFDTKCHHLAFRQESVDWQIWIDAGEKPLPMKLVITYKESPANLEYTAYLSKWNLGADIPASRFTFTPPADVKKVDFAAPSSQPADAAR